MHSLNNATIQRLIDGELSFKETQQLLRDARSRPETWSSIATAFVEDQLWKSEFSNEQEFGFQCSSPERSTRVADTKGIAGGLKWLALAATFLLTGGIGFLLFESQRPVTDSNANLVLVDKQSSPSPEAPLMDLARSDANGDDLNQTPAVYRMKLEDPKGNPFLDSDVPIYSGRQTDVAKWLDQNKTVPESIQRRAAASGYQMQQNVRYLSGRFKDGRQFVIPVRKYSFQPSQ